ncbi:MAG: hypothetical protein AAFU78_22605, partial [Cyanobacteria bacterium J06633_2]
QPEWLALQMAKRTPIIANVLAGFPNIVEAIAIDANETGDHMALHELREQTCELSISDRLA